MASALNISNRLKTVVDLLPPCGILADIGSNHGLLPIWLLLHNRIRYGWCCDLRSASLDAARKNIAEYGLTDKVGVLVGDGLQALNGMPYDCAVIAGMGGETIAKILDEAEIGEGDQHTFVLQPMSKSTLLRQWLAKNGFCVVDFLLAEDRGKIYECLSVKKGPVETELLYRYIGGKNPRNAGLYGAYLRGLRDKYRFRIRGMEGAEAPDIHRLAELRWLVENLENLLREE